MGKTYTIDELSLLFSVHRCTLRRWALRLNIEPQRDASNFSRMIYSEEQVLLLAEKHNRIAVLAQSPALLSGLQARIADLEARVAHLEKNDTITVNPLFW